MEKVLRAERVNVGCGMSPTPGWINVDNSLSIRLSRHPWISRIGRATGLINEPRARFIEFARSNAIQLVDVRKSLPFADNSLAAIYSSHMLEHLDRWTAAHFLDEAYRCLAPGGVIRLAVPDLNRKALNYLQSGDADEFIASLHMNIETPATWQGVVRSRVVPFRDHRWMYDLASLSRLLLLKGFATPVGLEPGRTTMTDPGELNLAERPEESLYVEACKP